MFSKRSFISVLALIMVISLVLAGCGKSSTDEPEPTTEVSKDYANTIFDGAYWHLSYGSADRDNYEARFSYNGTLTAVRTDASVMYDGTYTYDGTNLTVKLAGHELEYASDGDGFASVQEFAVPKSKLIHYTVEKSTKALYESTYKAYSENDSLHKQVINTLSDYVTVTRKIIYDDINYAESVYGTATALPADPGYMRFTFPGAPVKFEIEYHYDNLKKGTISFDVADMGLSDEELEEFEKGCSIVLDSDNSIVFSLNSAHNGITSCKFTVHGFVDGHFTEDGGFTIEAIEFKSSIPET